MVISIVFGIAIAIFMLIFGLWGGADILALISLSFLSPIPLTLINGLPSPTNPNYLSLIVPLSLSVIINAALLQIPLPLVILTKNYLSYRKNPALYSLPQSSPLAKVFASNLGEPLSMSAILQKPLFYYQSLEKNSLYANDKNLHELYPVPFIRLTSEPLLRWKQYRKKSFSLLRRNKVLDQRTDNPLLHQDMKSNKWQFDFSIGLKSEEEDLFRQRTLLQQATKKGNLRRSTLWVQYSIPFLIPMFIGYILAFNGFNILFEILKLL